MKAFIVDRYGKKDGVRIGEMPDPEVRENDVLVQVHAAGVNLLDSKIRNGEFKLLLPYRLPLILGNDVAGVVVRVGSRVRRFKPGDQVYAWPPQDRIGSFAELISMNEDAVAIIPKKLTMEEAASIPLVGLATWQALIERANLKKGQKVLIHAGSGGVGTFAIQLAKHLGAIVATTTSTANLDLVKSLGADTAIDYKTTDFEKVPRDYDVVLNSLGTETLNKSLQVLKPDGKLISISGPPDADFAKDMGSSRILRQVMRLLSYRIRKKAKRHHVSYSFLFMKADGDQLRAITSLIDPGSIRSVVDRVFPFESIKEAMTYVRQTSFDSRYSFRTFRVFIVMLVYLGCLVAPSLAHGAELRQDTLVSWNAYLDAARPQMASQTPFLWVDQKPESVQRVRDGEILVSSVGKENPKPEPSGLIHDWIGTAFFPNASIKDILSAARDYSNYKEYYKPTVVDSKLLSSDGSCEKYSMRVVNKEVVAETALDMDYETCYFKIDDRRWYSTTHTTRVQEIRHFGRPDEQELSPDHGSGFVWRLYSVARFEQRDGGTYVEVEAIALSRDIPAALRWVVNPIVRRVSRNSMLVSLQQMKEAVHLTEDAERAAKLPTTAHNGSRGTFASEVGIAKSFAPAGRP